MKTKLQNGDEAGAGRKFRPERISQRRNLIQDF
jgi:hypothetical protein